MQNGDIIGMVFCKLIQRAMVGQALVYFDDFAAERPRTGLEWRAKIASFEMVVPRAALSARISCFSAS